MKFALTLHIGIFLQGPRLMIQLWDNLHLEFSASNLIQLFKATQETLVKVLANIKYCSASCTMDGKVIEVHEPCIQLGSINVVFIPKVSKFVKASSHPSTLAEAQAIKNPSKSRPSCPKKSELLRSSR